MESSKSLAGRLQEVFLDGQWIARTNYNQIVSDVTWKEAAFKSGNLNTIADLVFHVQYYIKGVQDFFDTGELTIRDKFSFDSPALSNETEWEERKKEFNVVMAKFVETVSDLSERQLNEVFVKEAYGTYRRNIEAMIEHAYYHLGQISLLKKLVRHQVRRQ